jgi:hypothetical protein
LAGSSAAPHLAAAEHGSGAQPPKTGTPVEMGATLGAAALVSWLGVGVGVGVGEGV